MTARIRNFWSFILRHKTLTIVLLLCVIGYGVYTLTMTTKAATQYVLTSVKKSMVVASVAGTGEVAATNQLDVQAQSSGMITAVNVKNGADVKTGQILAVIDQRNAVVSLKQAQASVESAKANLAKVLAGATSADLQSVQASVDSATLAVKNAQRNLEQTKSQQETAVKNAYRSLTNAGLTFVAGPVNRTTGALVLSGTYAGTAEGQYMITLFGTNNGTHYMISGLETGEGRVEAGTIVPLGSQGLFVQFPANVFDGDQWTLEVPNVRSASYLNARNAYETAKQTQIQSLQSAQQSVDSATLNLQQAQANLALKKVPPSTSDVATAQAQMYSAYAQLESAQNTYANCFVKAPFDGKIAALNAKVGDQAANSTVVATLITKQMYASVPFNEVDVAKIKIGQKATLTFDAIDTLSLTGGVGEVQTIGTVTQGVVNYTVKVAFDTQDERVKPGMSVRAAIITDTRQDVLTLPNGAIKTQGGQSYVEIAPQNATGTNNRVEVTDGTPTTRQTIQTGLTSDTVTEIVSGLKEGDLVVSQTIDLTKTATASTSANKNTGIPGLTGGGGAMRAIQGGR